MAETITRRVAIATGAAFGLTAGADATSLCTPVRLSDPETGLALEPGWRWQAINDVPVRLQEIYPATLDHEIIVAGGFSPDVASGEPMGVLDRAFRGVTWGDEQAPCGDGPRVEWHEIAPLPEPRHHPNLVGHQAHVYAIGGFRVSPSGAWTMIPNLTRYDRQNDVWSETTPLPEPFAETCAVSLGGFIHVATGRQPAAASNGQWVDHQDSGAHFAFDPDAQEWTRRAPNPNPRNSAAGVTLDGKFHVIGGRRVDDGNKASHEAYDPVSDTWHSRAPLPQAQGGLAAAVSGGRIFAFGGEYFSNGGGVYPQLWIYNARTDAWEAGPDMATPRHGLGGVSIDGHIYAIGGATGPSGQGTSNIVERLSWHFI